MSPDLIVHLSQFGAAGLIGVLWVLERRYAAQRNRELSEAHRRLMSAERDARVLLNVVKENTRAIVTLESAQRQLIDLLQALAARDRGRSALPPAAYAHDQQDP